MCILMLIAAHLAEISGVDLAFQMERIILNEGVFPSFSVGLMLFLMGTSAFPRGGFALIWNPGKELASRHQRESKVAKESWVQFARFPK